MRGTHLLRLTLAALFAGILLIGRPTLSSAAAQAIIDPELAALAGSTEPVGVIVTFDGDAAPTATQLDLLRQAGITSGFGFRALPMAGALATPAQAEALAALPGVRSVYLNRQLQYFNAEANAYTGVTRVRTDAKMTARNGGLPLSGKGVTVVVNDSGVDGTHPDLQFGPHLVQNVLGSTNLYAYSDLAPIVYAENVPNTDTNSGHGTHVAGSVGATGQQSAGKYAGVAPGASLIGYGSGAFLFVLDGIGGFDYALANQSRYGIRIITNSWGSSGPFDPEHPINLASKRAADSGMVVLFAAGNEGPGENTHNPYAKAPWVISVAAGDKQGNLADFSSRGTPGFRESFTLDGQSFTYEDRPTVTAPGVDIISTRTLSPIPVLSATKDARLIEPAFLPFYTTLSGTSMATPHVAGIVALMLEANPTLSPARVKELLEKTATPMAGREPWEVGAGYVNAYAAVERAIAAKR